MFLIFFRASPIRKINLFKKKILCFIIDHFLGKKLKIFFSYDFLKIFVLLVSWRWKNHRNRYFSKSEGFDNTKLKNRPTSLTKFCRNLDPRKIFEKNLLLPIHLEFHPDFFKFFWLGKKLLWIRIISALWIWKIFFHLAPLKINLTLEKKSKNFFSEAHWSDEFHRKSRGG